MQSEEKYKKFVSIIGTGFANLLDEDDEMNPGEIYINSKKSYIAEREIGPKRHNEIPDLSA